MLCASLSCQGRAASKAPRLCAGPRGRVFAACTIWQNCLIVFGGELSRSKCANDVHLLNLATWQFTQPVLLGKCPAPRRGAAVCVHGAALLSQEPVLFLCQSREGGGLKAKEVMAVQDFFTAGDKLFLHGGRASLLLDDLFTLDLTTKTWVEILAEGLLPSARLKHILCISSNRLYLTGGDGAQLGLAYMYSMQLPSSQPGRYCPAKLHDCKHQSLFKACANVFIL